jgi:hypothetical protein
VNPSIGRIVHFYDPKLTTRIGWGQGYGGRGTGPYAAMVVNDLGAGPELAVFTPGHVGGVRHINVKHKDHVDRKEDEVYWEFPAVASKKPAADKE